MGVPFVAPLRCMRCHAPIEKKPKAKTPKYCPSCRRTVQADWKKQLKDVTNKRLRR